MIDVECRRWLRKYVAGYALPIAAVAAAAARGEISQSQLRTQAKLAGLVTRASGGVQYWALNSNDPIKAVACATADAGVDAVAAAISAGYRAALALAAHVASAPATSAAPEETAETVGRRIAASCRPRKAR